MRIDLDEASSGCAPCASDHRVKSNQHQTDLLRVHEEHGYISASLNERSLRSLDRSKLRAEIAGLCGQGRSRVILLSMHNTESVASSVLGTLAQLSVDMERCGGMLVLYDVPREVSRVMKKTRLHRLIHIARDRENAARKAKGLSRRRSTRHRHRAA